MQVSSPVVLWFYMAWAVIPALVQTEENENSQAANRLAGSNLTNTKDERFNKMAIFKTSVKKRRSPLGESVTLGELTNFLKENEYWKEGSELKRQTQGTKRVFKCQQQNSDIVTCFGDGQFYQFDGSLDSLDAGSLSGLRSAQDVNKAKKKRFIFKSWRSKSDKKEILDSTAAREEEAANRKVDSLPKSCYGFLAQKVTPQKLYKANVGKQSSSNVDMDFTEAKGLEIESGSKAKEPLDQTATGQKEKRNAIKSKMHKAPQTRIDQTNRLPGRQRARRKQTNELDGCTMEAPLCTTTKPCKTTCSTTCPTTKACRTTTCRTTTCPTTSACSTFCWSKCPPYEFTEQPLPTVTCSSRCPPKPTCSSCGQTSPCPCDKAPPAKSNKRKPTKVTRNRFRKRSQKLQINSHKFISTGGSMH